MIVSAKEEKGVRRAHCRVTNVHLAGLHLLLVHDKRVLEVHLLIQGCESREGIQIETKLNK